MIIGLVIPRGLGSRRSVGFIYQLPVGLACQAVTGLSRQTQPVLSSSICTYLLSHVQFQFPALAESQTVHFELVKLMCECWPRTPSIGRSMMRGLSSDFLDPHWVRAECHNLNPPRRFS